MDFDIFALGQEAKDLVAEAQRIKPCLTSSDAAVVETTKARLAEIKRKVLEDYNAIAASKVRFDASWEEYGPKINEGLKDILKQLQDWKIKEDKIAAVGKVQKDKEFEVLSALGSKVADLIEAGVVRVDEDMKDFVIKLNRSGGIATVASQGSSYVKGEQCRPFLEFFIWRKDTSVLKDLQRSGDMIVLGGFRDKDGDRDYDVIPLKWNKTSTTRSVKVMFDESCHLFEQRHTELTKLTDMQLYYDMKGLELVKIFFLDECHDAGDFCDRMEPLLNSS